MLTLGIETSGWDGSVALVKDRTTLAEIILPREGRRHAQMLVPKIGELVESCDLKLTDLDQIAVSVGPGSFTGLRVGVVCAKTLAYSLGCSLCPVMTLDVVAKMIAIDSKTSRLCVIADAQREEIYSSVYNVENEQWIRQADVKIVPIDSWLKGIEEKTIISGPGVKRHMESLGDSSLLEVLDEQMWNPTASVVALCAQETPEKSVNPMELEPFYLRPSAAEEKWNQKLAT